MEQTGKTKLLTVEGTSLVEGLGVIVAPGIPVEGYRGPLSRSVTLRKPDGEERMATVGLDIPRRNPPAPALYYLCLVLGITSEDVPSATMGRGNPPPESRERR